MHVTDIPSVRSAVELLTDALIAAEREGKRDDREELPDA